MTTPFPCRLLNQKDLLRKDLIGGKRSDGRNVNSFRDAILSEYKCKDPEDVLCIARIGATRVSSCISLNLRESDPDLNLIHLKATYPGDPRRTPFPAANDEDSDHEVDMDNMEDRTHTINLEREVLLETLIDEFDLIDESKLILIPGRVVVHLFITINVLHDDGCVIDTAFLALVASLQRVRLPKWSHNPSEDSFSYDWDSLQSAELLRNPQVSSTFALIGTTVIGGPTAEEERAADTVVLAVAQGETSLLFFQVLDGSLPEGSTGEPLNQITLAANQQKMNLMNVLGSPPSADSLIPQDKIVKLNRNVEN
ncbi:hypothetical protein RvY_13108 [Ramazzottius varieornatus]|uniref:Ribosomal RNA-processing protein 43 n=1 Tax=Ramazzottius varieornatus TaxID=947166 RepID=A0A1D1VQV0_RAMVA|nr:hypothetical protein RvY_13108 [Ramazzottius varieornatus]